ncbi:VOC family protein [Cohnella caldifontis]|uniref:VOC family protein n=1 Tax=Cohnella caldifontis TaxID=3027471 RepID=UPI0023ECFD06|nr:VOC family protein [Cohnella sp. YIM B05605]
MGVLRPYISSTDARSQAQFYAGALGGEIKSVLTYGQAMGSGHDHKDKVMHLCVHVAGDNAIFMEDALDPIRPGDGISFNVSYRKESEGRAAFLNLAADGEVKSPYELQPFGIFHGIVKDRYGITWMITADEPDEKR